MKLSIASLCLLFLSLATSAQENHSAGFRIVMGHHHLQSGDVAADMAFWKTLGGEQVVYADYNVVKFPDVQIFIREKEPSDGTRGSIVNHIGLQFPDLRKVVGTLRSEEIEIITREFVGERYETDEDGLAWNDGANTWMAFALAPNGAVIELYENKTLGVPAANHHIHFYTPDVDEMKAWYVEMLGATPGQRTGMEAADLPGVNLTFSPATERFAGTRDRALAHIGFEVDNVDREMS